jgi:anti-sigma factor RsiW
MNCRRLEELIALYVGGDLPNPKQRTVNCHLQSCPRCARFADELKATRSALKGIGHVASPEGSLERVRAAVAAAQTTKPARNFRQWPLAAASGALALALAAALGLHGRLMRDAARHATATDRQQAANTDRRISPSPLSMGLGMNGAIAGKLAARSSAPTRFGPQRRTFALQALEIDHPSRPRTSTRGGNRFALARLTEKTVPRTGGQVRGSRDVPKSKEIRVKFITNDPKVVIYWLID